MRLITRLVVAVTLVAGAAVVAGVPVEVDPQDGVTMEPLTVFSYLEETDDLDRYINRGIRLGREHSDGREFRKAMGRLPQSTKVILIESVFVAREFARLELVRPDRPYEEALESLKPETIARYAGICLYLTGDGEVGRLANAGLHHRLLVNSINWGGIVLTHLPQTGEKELRWPRQKIFERARQGILDFTLPATGVNVSGYSMHSTQIVMVTVAEGEEHAIFGRVNVWASRVDEDRQVYEAVQRIWNDIEEALHGPMMGG